MTSHKENCIWELSISAKIFARLNTMRSKWNTVCLTEYENQWCAEVSAAVDERINVKDWCKL